LASSFDWELVMRRILAAAAVAALVLEAAPAIAAESTTLAVEAAFLLGNAQRCGVSADRIERVGRPIRDAIAAAAEDTDQQRLAGSRYQLVFRASAYPDTGAHATLTPDCRRVLSQFERLERHRVETAAED
jgi:hypothetical protein